MPDTAKAIPASAERPTSRVSDGALKPEAQTAKVPQTYAKPELLSPAGGLEAFFAAMDYGADAVYLGLKSFSARAQAENFTIEELNTAVGYAHERQKKVFVTINTVIQQKEYDELLSMLADCEEMGVDAIIVQDFGVYRTIREYFPKLKWHASTQMLVHNIEGAKWAERNGFERVILARELTLNEVDAIRQQTNIELETFVHGSLCYSYSGLCLFSSQVTGRSGNRGKCAYTCRDSFITPLGEGKAFSMKDLQAPTILPELAKLGVRSVKIEGRRKSPLYVAAVTDMYRKAIDGAPIDLKAAEEKLKVIYSRETTELFYRGSHNENKNVADKDESEPQGLYLGTIERVHNGRATFRAAAEFERHDGLMLKPKSEVRGQRSEGIASPLLSSRDGSEMERDAELGPGYSAKPVTVAEDAAGTNHKSPSPERQAAREKATAFRESGKSTSIDAGAQVSQGREPIKFGADKLNIAGKRVFNVKAGEDVTIPAPAGVQVGDEMRLINSQALRRQYPTKVPAKLPRARLKVNIDITFKIDKEAPRLGELGMPGKMVITGRHGALEVVREYPVKLLFADSQPMDEKKLREFFERLGSTRFTLGKFSAAIPAGVFTPAGEINEARRQFFAAFDEAVSVNRIKKLADVRAAITTFSHEGTGRHKHKPKFAAYVDRVEYLEHLPLDQLDEVFVEIANDRPEALLQAFKKHENKLRLALPIIVRSWEHASTEWKLRDLYAAGARRFSVSNLGGFEYLARTASIDKRKRLGTATIMRRSQDVATRRVGLTFEPKIPDFRGAGLDIVADWPLYTLSRETARTWLEQGCSRVTLSVEDGIENMRAILTEFGADADVVIYQDTPLFVAESCVYANMLGHCPGRAYCGFHEMTMKNSYGEEFLAVDHHCRTLIMGKEAFAIAHRAQELQRAGASRFRIDFVNRKFKGEEVRAICESAMRSQSIPTTNEGNWSRTLL